MKKQKRPNRTPVLRTATKSHQQPKGQSKIRPAALSAKPKRRPAPKQAAAEIQRKIGELTKRGRARGFITYSEILAAFPRIEDDIFLLENLYTKFEDTNIQVIETRDLLETEPKPAPVHHGRGKRDDLETEVDTSASVQMYLREIGRIPLITAGEDRKRVAEG